MSAARDKMLARLRFEALDSANLAAEADGLIERAHRMLDAYTPRKQRAPSDSERHKPLWPTTPKSRLTSALQGVRYLVEEVEKLRQDYSGDAMVVEAVLDLRNALSALDQVVKTMRATRADETADGALSRCVAAGACQKMTPRELSHDCGRPTFARDSDTPYLVRGYNGHPFPGRLEKRCMCGRCKK